MKAEIISVGTELLMGQTVNTNASFLSGELHDLGIESYFQTTVGDNEKRIHSVLDLALKRADLIITTGGLGPTSDDLTHESICSYFHAKPVLDRNILKKIIYKFKLKGYKKMPSINKKQAYKPKDAKWIPNKSGTANGIIWKVKASDSKLIMTFPGVPSEMIEMWNTYAKLYLQKLAKGNVFYTKMLKFTGIGESALAEQITSYFNLRNPTVAPYASLGEVKIRITARANNLSKAKKMVVAIRKKILAKTKKYYFGEDNDTLESLAGKLLTSKKRTVAVCESCTGGLLSKMLTDVPGSSRYIKLNAVTYSDKAKSSLLNIPDKIIKKYGAVSSQVASLMASGIKNLSDSDIGISITGIGGPSGGSKTKPVGLVYFGFAYKNKVKTRKMLFGKDRGRSDIRQLSALFALEWLRKELNKIS